MHIDELDQALDRWAETLPSDMTYSQANLFQQIVSYRHATFIATHAAYWQTRLVLHASLVPKFGGTASVERIPEQMIQRSAETAAQCAHALSTIARDLVMFSCDLATLAPFVGYSMYAAASVHMAMVGQDLGFNQDPRADLDSCAAVLRGMMPFWANLEGLVSGIPSDSFGSRSNRDSGRDSSCFPRPTTGRLPALQGHHSGMGSSHRVRLAVLLSL